MTEYTDMVEQVKRRHFAEKWGNEINYMLAEHGYIEVAKRNGSVIRTYSRDHGDHKKGDIIVLSEAMSIDRLVIEAPSNAEL